MQRMSDAPRIGPPPAGPYSPRIWQLNPALEKAPGCRSAITDPVRPSASLHPMFRTDRSETFGANADTQSSTTSGGTIVVAGASSVLAAFCAIARASARLLAAPSTRSRTAKIERVVDADRALLTVPRHVLGRGYVELVVREPPTGRSARSSSHLACRSPTTRPNTASN